MSKTQCIHKNDTSFPTESAHLIKKIYAKYQTIQRDTGLRGDAKLGQVLYYYQFLIRELFINPDFGIGQAGNSRGVLVYHGMGLGKTKTAIAIAMAMWNIRQPVLILPKSTQAQFVTEIDSVMDVLHPGETERKATVQSKFTFISQNSSNLGDMLVRKIDGGLNNKLLIIDEAHNVFRGIINSADENTGMRRLYDMVMKAKNLRIIFLTGTPAAKHCFELVCCFNMLMGKQLLPEQYDTFADLYIDPITKSIKNKDKLSNRLFGMVSHVSIDLANRPDVERVKRVPREDKGMPEDLGTEVIHIEMSEEQYRQYLLAREKEKAEGGGMGSASTKAPRALALPGSEGFGSSYYVASRQTQNFAPPDEILKKIRQGKKLAAKEQNIERAKNIELITSVSLTDKRSPKFAKALEIIGKSPGTVMVYSSFTGMGGLAIFEKYLIKHGYEKFAPGTTVAKSKTPRFASFKGDVDSKYRDELKNVFNNPENANGEIIRVFLISKTGAEGLDLKCIRRVILLEPYWNKSLEDQIQARAIRLGSHDTLPKANRDVRTYLLLAAPNKKIYSRIPEAEREDKTIDEWFHDRGLKNKKINGEFRQLLREVSFECVTNNYPNCRSCKPTDEPLYVDNPTTDLKMPDPCKNMAETQITPDGEIVRDGKKYLYKNNPDAPFNYDFFVFSNKLNGYVPLDQSDPLCMELLKTLDPEA